MSLSSILVVANALRLDAGRAVASATPAPRPTGRLVVADEPGE
jgi:Cu2+-exporting ATPase